MNYPVDNVIHPPRSSDTDLGQFCGDVIGRETLVKAVNSVWPVQVSFDPWSI